MLAMSMLADLRGYALNAAPLLTKLERYINDLKETLERRAGANVAWMGR